MVVLIVYGKIHPLVKCVTTKIWSTTPNINFLLHSSWSIRCPRKYLQISAIISLHTFSKPLIASMLSSAWLNLTFLQGPFLSQYLISFSLFCKFLLSASFFAMLPSLMRLAWMVLKGLGIFHIFFLVSSGCLI